MYQPLELLCGDLKNFAALLAANDANARVQRLSSAFEQTAKQIGERLSQSSEDAHRAHLQTVYRGLLAARRLVERLHELPGAGEAAPL
jgi:signal transduction protein with GAF and PtsI domain